MMISISSAMRLALALLALHVAVVKNAPAAQLPTCNGTVNATSADEGFGIVQCLVDQLSCSTSAFLQVNASFCGDGDFWQSCGSQTFNQAINGAIGEGHEVAVEDCVNGASEILRAAGPVVETPSDGLPQAMCIEFWGRFAEGIEVACREYVSSAQG